MSVITHDYLWSMPEEIQREIYMKVFDSCLDEMITLHELREQNKLYQQSPPGDCVCNTGMWCEDCYGEYDLFD